MQQLIAKDKNDYVLKAIDLTKNQSEFINLRKSIFHNAIKSPLFNQKKFSDNFYKLIKEITK